MELFESGLERLACFSIPRCGFAVNLLYWWAVNIAAARLYFWPA
jgi:hypothetical protein